MSIRFRGTHLNLVEPDEEASRRSVLFATVTWQNWQRLLEMVGILRGRSLAACKRRIGLEGVAVVVLRLLYGGRRRQVIFAGQRATLTRR